MAEAYMAVAGALQTFAGLSNPTAAPQALSRRELARYKGDYIAERTARRNTSK